MCTIYYLMSNIYRPHPKDGGKVLFSVCLSVHISGGYPVRSRGYPIPGLAGGVPHPRSGWGGTPSQVWLGGTPSQVWPGGYLIPGLARGVPHPRSGWGVPHPRSRERGYPIPGLNGATLGTPHPDLIWGYPGYPLTRSGWGNPP